MKLSRALFAFGVALTLAASDLCGQTLNVLHHFSAPMAFDFTNSDGTGPGGAMAFSGGAIYGTATLGGLYGGGDVYAINLDGTGFRSLHYFATPNPDWGTNTDGLNPNGVLISSNILYGSTILGGTNGRGTIFSLDTAVGGFNLLHTFSGLSDGAEPGPILKPGPLVYGYAYPTFFSVNPGGSNNFTAIDSQQPDLVVRAISGDAVYGTSNGGGDNGTGFVFSIKTNGSNFTVLHSFGAKGPNIGTNADGFEPIGLILSDHTLFGLNFKGGTNGQNSGTVYSLSTDGTAFKLVHAFTTQVASGIPSALGSTNWDGGEPVGNPVLSGHTLYGVAETGGAKGYGTLFSVNTNGEFFTVLHTFSALKGGAATNNDGACPTTCFMYGGVIYGTTQEGGMNDGGALFSLTVPAPRLRTIRLAETSLTLDATGGLAGGTYTLLSSPDPSLPFTQWTPVATNTLDGTGSGTFTTSASPASTQNFFVLQIQ
jgi:uncharacterized repeat protein (TIGR03803 family)